MLFWAVLSDDVEAAHEILDDCGEVAIDEVLRPLKFDLPELALHGGMTPVHLAMAFARWELVVELLGPVRRHLARGRGGSRGGSRERGVSRLGVDGKGWDALLWACVMGRDDNVRNWISATEAPCGKDTMERRVLGASPLAYAVWMGGAGNSLAVFEALLEGGVDLGCITSVGLTLLHEVALNPDATAEFVERLLEVPEIRSEIGRRMVPRKCKWSCLFKIAKMMVSCGSQNGLVVEYNSWYKGSALHLAAGQGNIVVVRALVKHGANRQARNGVGRTPLELARDAFGGEVPAALAREL